MLELAKDALARQDYNRAFEYAQAAGENHPDDRIRKEMNEVNMAAVRREETIRPGQRQQTGTGR